MPCAGNIFSLRAKCNARKGCMGNQKLMKLNSFIKKAYE
jgi:hypothetical protein